MKKYSAESIRNVVLLSHVGVGKTSLAEAALYTAKSTSKMGKVDSGTSVFDTRADEKDRKMTISMTVGFCEWNDTKVNILDAPGFADFSGDVKAALRVVESAVLLIDGADGIQVGTETTYRSVDEAGLPRMFFINHMDAENADFQKVVASLKEAYGTSVAPMVMPIGSGGSFKGVVDLVTKEAFEYTAGGDGRGKKIDIPAELTDTVESTRNALMEAVAESDEELLNKFFEAGELSDDDLRRGLAQGVLQGLVYPVLSGSATANIGVDQLLFKLTNLSPAASSRTEVKGSEGDEEKMVQCGESAPTSALVFKTLSEEHLGEVNIVRVFGGKLTTGLDLSNSTQNSGERMGSLFFTKGHERVDTNEIPAGDIGALLKLKDTHTGDTLIDRSMAKTQIVPIEFGEPLVSVAVRAKSKGDDDKVSTGLNKLREEDRSFTFGFRSDIRQSILSTMGDIHIDVILNALKARFKVEVEKYPPKISYRETVTKPAKYVEYTHKKQTGGAGQYARVFIDLEPTERGSGYEFEDKIVGGVIDQPLRPSVDKGIRAKMNEGIIAGYPIVDVKVSLVDGKTHPVDSKDVAFQIAGREVFKKAFESASPILLEPIADVRVTVPDEYTGDVMGDLSSRRGRIGGMEPEGKYQIISAKVPEAEIQNYSQSLRSITQGRAFYTKSFSHYEPVPPDVTKKVVEMTQREQESE